jgi:hypothetical protein
LNKQKTDCFYSIANVINRLEAIHASQYTQEEIKHQVDPLKTTAQGFEQKIKAMKFQKE